MSLNENKKVAIVTGATSGIGKEISYYLHDNNFIVYSLSREYKNDEKINYIKCDIANFLETENVIKKIFINHKKVDLIINNSGFSINSPVECLNIENYEKMLRINVEAPYAISMIYKKYLKGSSGKIINIGSITSEVYIPFESQYCLTKKLLKIFSVYLNKKFRLENIKVCNLIVGKTKTNFDKNRIINEINENDYFYEFSKFNKNLIKSSKYGTNPNIVAKAVFKIIKQKKNKSEKIVGLKTKIVFLFLNVFPLKIINKINFYFFIKKG